MAYDLSPVGGRSSWKGSELDYHKDGLWQLSEAELKEIDQALAHLRSLGDLDLPEITAKTFPLKTVGEFLERLRDELHSGRGFVLIRGISRDRYSDDDLARIYCGLGAHLGVIIPQSGNGELLGHVLNVADLEKGPVRGYRTAGSMNMHVDGHDVVALLCLREAKEGGASRIASSVAVHDHMVKTRPDLAEVLYQGMHVSRGKHDADMGDGRIVTPTPVAIFSKDGGEFNACVHVAQTRDAAKMGAFTMTEKQSEALDYLCELTASPEFYLDMNIAPGDIQFLNNRLIVHGRAHYEDHPELHRRRYLMRLWLNIPSWKRRPPSQDDIYSEADLPGWARQRKPFMELPDNYMKAMASKRATEAAA